MKPGWKALFAVSALLVLASCGSGPPPVGKSALSFTNGTLAAFTATYALAGPVSGNATWTVVPGAKADTTSLATTGGGAHESDTLAVANGKTENLTLALHKPWVENEELLTYLSGLSLQSGESGSIEDVIVQHATTATVGLSVGKKTAVTTVAGTFQAYPVSITTSGQTPQTAWVMASAPLALFGYQNGKEVYSLTAITP